jgi:hypothetical protein
MRSPVAEMMMVEDSSSETEARPAPKPRKKSERKRRTLKPVTGAASTLGRAARRGRDEIGLDDINIVTPEGPILDPFFEAPTGDPRKSVLGELDPQLFEEPTNFPEARSEYHSHPEEITSKMEALVLSQIASIRDWSGEGSETDPKHKPSDGFDISDISLDTTSGPHGDHETQPSVPAMNLPIVADLMEETGVAPKGSVNGKPAARSARKRKHSKT